MDEWGARGSNRKSCVERGQRRQLLGKGEQHVPCGDSDVERAGRGEIAHAVKHTEPRVQIPSAVKAQGGGGMAEMRTPKLSTVLSARKSISVSSISMERSVRSREDV